MKRLLLFCTAAALISGPLDAQRSDRARAWFPDGTGLEIHTETTGNTGSNSAGEIGIAWDRVNRIVIDKTKPYSIRLQPGSLTRYSSWYSDDSH